MSRPEAPSIEAADPGVSVFLTANAGSGKTATLIDRVARLLLAHAKPETILCVTYTRAAAAEMQRRLFKRLGDWSVMEDDKLRGELAAIEETARDLAEARRLFARALETPGGLQIQTIHAFCEKLLRRFPLEAGISPGFTVLEDQAAAEVSARARQDVARLALAYPDTDVARAYAHLSVELDFAAFDRMFGDFETRRAAIRAYLAAVGPRAIEDDVWRRCGFSRPASADDIRAQAFVRATQARWKRAAAPLLATGMASDGKLGARLIAVGPSASFDELRDIFLTKACEPRKSLGTARLDAATRAWLDEEQARIVQACEHIKGATIAADTLHALTLATAYAELYEGAKTARGALDFGDLIGRAGELLTSRADVAWVLHKMDGGIEHFLLDEAQDTAPEQWDILRALTAEFFTGLGARGGGRTVFAVADEKQSIFSFQGAAPERFAQERAAFRATIAGAGERFVTASLDESRRSRPEVLAFVDTVFAEPQALAGLAPSQPRPDAIRHGALRVAGGCVELWPPEAGEEPPEVDPWRPVDEGLGESANRKLARRVARTIKATVERKAAVGDRTADDRLRPCRFGDFLILVRRRNALFHEIIRALKREGVAVGGADRLRLSEHGLFRDLVALARFSRFPADDLSLAEVLRGPFCDLNEDDLFDLAYDRRGPLWAELCRRAHERPSWTAARDLLTWLVDQSGRSPPFDFFNRALSRIDGDGRSMRQRILTRLGAEAQDALEAFLCQAAIAEARAVRDLETFIAGIDATELEVKREQEEGQGGAAGEVRVMTVHGAKGLEAPIVILPDTSTRATAQGGPLLAAADGGFLWAPRKVDDCPASAQARERREVACEQESLRLLYVALTRARDRLILCGVDAGRLFERSWRDYIDRAFTSLPARSFPLEGGGEGRRFGPDPVIAPDTRSLAPEVPPPPGWTIRLAPSEPALAGWRSPSTLTETVGPCAPSPLEAVNGLGRYRRGEIIHRLLQLLPDIPAAGREAACRRLLDAERDLSEDQRSEMAGAAMRVLAHRRFAAVFGPGSRAEVALAGTAARLPKGLAISGRLDRLMVAPDKVLVVDFKTNRPAPRRIEDCDKSYITQMAIYAAVLAEIFPGRAIEAALVWTDGPRLMAVPEKLIARALDDLAGIG
ncbi:MAG TPA: double-strand break repair helicase AddA [Caulobacteraceae bacterium]